MKQRSTCKKQFGRCPYVDCAESPRKQTNTSVSLLAFWEHGTTSSKLCVSFLVFICEANKNEQPSVRVGGTTTTNKAE
ncbi:hypothetical protein [Bacillus cereus]|uniref:hypothetical protein n=1 Tax=Bacillus cereus TaxID=1396 RepID=UPI0024BCE06A|nr:hypothetical protein [Bacillus cereus]